MGFMDGCVAIVTGGSTGIGYGCAEAMAAAGCTVILTARTEADGQKAEADLKALGLPVAYMRQDVSSEDDWKRLLGEVDAKYGRLDFLINNAGISQLFPIEETTAESLKTLVSVNLTGAYYGVKHAAPAIIAAYDQRGFPGMIVNVSSVLSRIGQAGAVAYCATKGGMAGMNQVYERLLVDQKDKVQIKSILPGYTMTPQVDKAIGRDSPLVTELAQTIPLRRWGEPEETADALMMMLNPAIALEDMEVLVDGGFLAS
ncbi:MAG: SDR family NAD(P)-dependent oxidoreductase [Alphaproteobacteria bacterium]